MKTTATFFLILFSILSYGQDIIEFKNEEKKQVKITEISDKEIKYKEFNNLDGPTFSISKNKIKKINYANGKEEIFIGDNPRENNRFGFNYLNLGSPSILLSLSVDYFITTSINIEVGAGLIGYYGGFKYHFMGSSEKNWTPYIGAYAGSIAQINLSSNNSSKGVVYIPVGMQYIANGGFTFGVEVAGIFNENVTVPVWGAIKLGHHF